MKDLKKVRLVMLVLVIPIVLTACGGGSAGSNTEATPVTEPVSLPASFTAMTNDLFAAAIDSEPLDVAKMDINSDADDETVDTSDRTQTTTFSSVMTENTK